MSMIFFLLIDAETYTLHCDICKKLSDEKLLGKNEKHKFRINKPGEKLHHIFLG